MAEVSNAKDMEPHFEDIQAHYDLSDDFFGLFQDPTRKYSCAYFTGPSVTLSDAQIANVDLNLDKLDLKPGMTLLEIGCGWGLTMKRAMGSTTSTSSASRCRRISRRTAKSSSRKRTATGLSTCGWKAGSSSLAGRPDRLHRSFRALRLRAL